MNTLPKDVAQMLITKLDLGHATPKETKEHAARYGVTLVGRTREQVARSIGKAIEKPAVLSHYESAITGANEKRRDQLIAGLKLSQ